MYDYFIGIPYLIILVNLIVLVYLCHKSYVHSENKQITPKTLKLRAGSKTSCWKWSQVWISYMFCWWVIFSSVYQIGSKDLVEKHPQMRNYLVNIDDIDLNYNYIL